jgi:peptidoglycan/LPS O-acetylase OafA/YrhL
LVALVFWLAGSTRRFAWGWLGVEALSLLVLVLSTWQSPLAHWTAKLILQPDYLSWFTIGITAFYFWHGIVTLPVVIMAALAMIGLVVMAAKHEWGMPAEYLVLEIAVLSTFALIVFRTPLAGLFRMRWAVMLGMASYPLYMFHEKVGIVVMNALADAGLPVVIVPVAVAIALIAVAFTIHHAVELPAKSALLRKGLPAAKRLESMAPGLRFDRVRQP